MWGRSAFEGFLSPGDVLFGFLGTTVSELAANLGDRFELLTVGRRADSRHRSLRTVVDWSYQQLTPGQRELFGQLAVFYGSFDASAAVAVAGPDDPATVTRLLLHLVDRSLVIADLDGGTVRYRLLETLRSYGLERLAEHGLLGTARARHARWASDLAAQADSGLRGASEASWAATLERHLSDLRAAHGWLASQDTELSLRMAAQLHWYALWRCQSEVFRWADASTAAAAGSRSPFYPEALASAAFGAVYRGDMQAADAAARTALDAAQGMPAIRARRPLEALGEVAVFRGELTAAADSYTRAYDLSISNGDFLDAAWDAASAAAAYAYGNRLREANRLADQARAAADKSRSPSALAFAAWASGEIAAEGTSGQAGSTYGEQSRWPRPQAVVSSSESRGSHWPRWTHGAAPFGADADRLRQSAALLRQHLTETQFRAAARDGEQMDGSQIIHCALEAIARAATRP